MIEFSMEHSIGEVAPPIDELMSFSAKTPLGKRLDKIAETYPRFRHTGRIIDYCSSALFGFSLTLASAEWEPSDTKFLDSRLEKVDENLALATFVRSSDAARNFYGFMWGFVLGQYSAELLTDKEFMSSKSVVGEAVLRNQIHAS